MELQLSAVWEAVIFLKVSSAHSNSMVLIELALLVPSCNASFSDTRAPHQNDLGLQFGVALLNPTSSHFEVIGLFLFLLFATVLATHF